MADTTLSKEDRDKAILRLWAEGRTSGQIAYELNITRNIAMGIVHRARIKGMSVDPSGHHEKYAFGGRKGLERARKLTRDAATALQPKQGGQGKVAVPQPTVAPLATSHNSMTLFPSNPGDNTAKSTTRQNVPIYRLMTNGCKFPVGVNKKGEHVFCNAPAHKRHYCKTHYAVSFVPPTRENTRKATQTWVK